MQRIQLSIVGQGLAGSVLALQSLRRGLSIRVFASKEQPQATRIAAGLYHPFLAQKNQLIRSASEKWRDLIDFYTYAEKLLGEHFFYPLPMYRPFIEKNKEDITSDHPFYPWIEKQVDESLYSKWLDNSKGGILTTHAGYVDTAVFLEAVKKYLIQLDCYQEVSLKEKDFEWLSNGVCISGVESDKVVFCTGASYRMHSLFQWLPISLLKGDVFKIKLKEQSFPHIINKKYFIIPLQQHIYRAGSTYHRSFQDATPTPEGKEELEKGLQDMLYPDFEVVEHVAGIRPNSGDHHPIVGPHPFYKQCFCVNGFGSKGIAYAPYTINALLDYICIHKPIDAFISVERFYSLYYKNLK
ncbi:MAG: FAD-binding oxidoreductase [Cytophagaceae bacterium]|jgi:glycine/D-amino acid oxidase-like deaminating enzyme|nr:FAD-binding oxidoreductase [Cytophagaceae bacterium]